MIENFIFSGLNFLNQQKLDNFVLNNVKNISYFNNKNIIDFKQNDQNKKDYFESTKIDKNSIGMSSSVKSGIIFDYDTGEIFWSKNENEKRSIASLTKIMTVLVFFDTDYDLNKFFKINKDDVELEKDGAANAGLVVGDEVMIGDLLKLTLIGSKNDATNALVRSTGLSDEEFIKKMNEKAKFYGLNDTFFDNINGLSSYNKSTAKDLSKLFYYAFSNKTIREISTMKKYTFISKGGNIYSTLNTNKLLGNDIFSVIAGKTGYLDDAQYCLSTLTKIDDKKILSVFLGSDTDSKRFYDAKVLNWWVYKNYKKNINND